MAYETYRVEVGVCPHQRDGTSDTCRTGLVGADLANADLRWLDGWKIDLRGANLTGAHLQDAVLEHARLDGTLLTWAHLDRARLDGATLTGAVLREAKAPQARLIDADLAYAILREADHGKADLTDVDLERADLAKINLEGATWRRDQSYSCYLRSAQTLGQWDACLDLRALAYDDGAALELERTASLFERACSEQRASPLATHGVVQRLWHEFDYSHSHDQEGYDRVADLRYLLARLILSPELCWGAASLPERDFDQLQNFLSQWCSWRDERDEPDKPIESGLERSWSDLRARVGASGQAAETDALRLRDIWERLDGETSDQRSCPELVAAQADGD